jgi:hypothetical protein
MLIHLDDDLYAAYAAAATAAKRPVREVIEGQLLRFLPYPPTRRSVVLSEDTLATLEALFRGGSLDTEAKVVERMQAWAGITIGHVRLDFSPEQLREVGVRATKQNKAPREVVEDIVAQLQDQFFYGPVVVR